jgi:hypothetical protein
MRLQSATNHLDAVIFRIGPVLTSKLGFDRHRPRLLQSRERASVPFIVPDRAVHRLFHDSAIFSDCVFFMPLPRGRLTT